jgi:hypothetical protein
MEIVVLDLNCQVLETTIIAPDGKQIRVIAYYLPAQNKVIKVEYIEEVN